MDSLAGVSLLKADGSTVEADAHFAEKKMILYYFSAHWCPPCRQFTPILKDFYGEVAEKYGLEVVFISSDKNKDEMLSYMKESHGDWLALEHNSDVSKELRTKYGISGIPTCVVVKQDGTEVTKEARAHIAQKSPEEAIKEWGGEEVAGGEEAPAEEGGEEEAPAEEGGEDAPPAEEEGGDEAAPAEDGDAPAEEEG